MACRERGFFYVTGHGVSAGLLAELADASTEFFALPAADKLEIAMERGGRAWRGFFPVGAELTSGQPDLKEGLYFGAELPGDDPRVLAGLPLHGRNLFPRQVPRLRPLVLAYLDALTSLGQAVLAGVAQSLGLDAGYFATGYTADPTILFRIFHYPPSLPQGGGWGVGEHTDYGLVTLLAQDDSGGLQVATPEGWIDAPPAFLTNDGYYFTLFFKPLAREVREHTAAAPGNPPLPTTLAEVIALLDAREGVHYAALVTAIAPAPEAAEQALHNLLDTAATIELNLQPPASST